MCFNIQYNIPIYDFVEKEHTKQTLFCIQEINAISKLPWINFMINLQI